MDTVRCRNYYYTKSGWPFRHRFEAGIFIRGKNVVTRKQLWRILVHLGALTQLPWAPTLLTLCVCAFKLNYFYLSTFKINYQVGNQICQCALRLTYKNSIYDDNDDDDGDESIVLKFTEFYSAVVNTMHTMYAPWSVWGFRQRHLMAFTWWKKSLDENSIIQSNAKRVCFFQSNIC